MIIEVSGVWDLLHVGHIRLFQKARSIAPPGEDVTLLVGVHSDTDVMSYKRRPIIPHDQRLEMVSACRYVDGVIPNAPLVYTESHLDKHAIDVVVHAHDENDTDYDELYKIPMELGKFRRLNYSPATSTSKIIASLSLSRQKA